MKKPRTISGLGQMREGGEQANPKLARAHINGAPAYPLFRTENNNPTTPFE